MSKADKKHRQKTKRKEKQQESRRRESAGPVKRLAEARGEFQCWMSDNFEEFGQLDSFVHKRAAGLVGMAAFLVDRGVVGLKDAWTRMNVDEQDFMDMIKSCGDSEDV